MGTIDTKIPLRSLARPSKKSIVCAYGEISLSLSLVVMITLTVSFLGFLLLYAFAYFLIYRHRKSLVDRANSASCVMSLAHGTPVALMSFLALLLRPFTAFSFASTNTPFENAVLDFSLAYFFADLVHYTVFLPVLDPLFVAHHLATAFVLATCRYLATAGAGAILALLFLAEITSLCQNVWTLSRARRTESALAATICRLLSPPFYALYSIVRGIIGPALTYKMAVFYLGGGADRAIPRWLSASWIVVIVSAIGVSILWIVHLWVELCHENLKLRSCSSSCLDSKERKVR